MKYLKTTAIFLGTLISFICFFQLNSQAQKRNMWVYAEEAYPDQYHWVDNLQNGSEPYVEVDFSIDELPDEVKGLKYMKTMIGDRKAARYTMHIEFEIDKPAVLYTFVQEGDYDDDQYPWLTPYEKVGVADMNSSFGSWANDDIAVLKTEISSGLFKITLEIDHHNIDSPGDYMWFFAIKSQDGTSLNITNTKAVRPDWPIGVLKNGEPGFTDIRDNNYNGGMPFDDVPDKLKGLSVIRTPRGVRRQRYEEIRKFTTCEDINLYTFHTDWDGEYDHPGTDIIGSETDMDIDVEGSYCCGEEYDVHKQSYSAGETVSLPGMNSGDGDGSGHHLMYALEPVGDPAYNIELTSHNDGDVLENVEQLTLESEVTSGNVDSVEFFIDSIAVGHEVKTIKIGTDKAAPYEATWDNVVSGKYRLRAKGHKAEGCGYFDWADVTIKARPVFSAVRITPQTGRGLPGDSIQFTAEALDQHGEILQTQPGFSWSLPGNNDNDIDQNGMVYTQSNKGGPFKVVAEATVDGKTMNDTAEFFVACNLYAFNINGEEEYVDSNGRTWSHEHEGIISGNNSGTSDPIENTSDETIYQSNVWGENLTADFPIANGTYNVTLKFVESFWEKNGERIFDVFMEGEKVIDSLDIYKEVGHDYALDITNTVEVKDNKLNIDFEALEDNALITGILINKPGGCDSSPNAAFTVDNTKPEVGETITFTDQSSGATSWNWEFGDGKSSIAQNPDHVYQSEGIYDVTLIINNGDDTLTKTEYINVKSKSETDFTVDNTNPCAGDTITFTDQSTGATSWEWKFGDNNSSTVQNPEYVYQTAGTYDVTLVINDGSDSTTKSGLINVQDQVEPSVAINADKQQICKGDAVTLTIDTAASDGLGSDPDYQWFKAGDEQGGEKSESYNTSLSATTKIKLKASSSLSCKSEDTAISALTIQVNDNITPSVSISGNNQICKGQKAEFDVTESIGGGNNPSYEWFVDDKKVADADGQSFDTSLSKDAEVKVGMRSDASCADPEKAFDSINVATGGLPEVSIKEDASFELCSGEDTTLHAQPYDPDNYQYQWYKDGNSIKGASSGTYTAGEGGVYRVEISTSSSCSALSGDSAVLTLNKKPSVSISTSGSTSFCQGDSVNLEANVSGKYDELNWSRNNIPAGADVRITAKKEGIYEVEVTNGICMDRASKEVTVWQQKTPQVSIKQVSDEVICKGETVSFKAVSSNDANPEGYTWYKEGKQSGKGSKFVSSYQNNVTLKVEMKSSFKCPVTPKASATHQVNIKGQKPAKPGPISGKDSVCAGDELTYSVPDDTTSVASYKWMTPEGSYITVGNNTNEVKINFENFSSSEGVLQVTAKNACGRSSAASFTIYENCPDIYIPNAFTPGRADDNTAWYIEGLNEYENPVIQVYNRWGTKVFESKGEYQPWKGRNNNGKELPVGTYYYIIKTNPLKKAETGSVTILR